MNLPCFEIWILLPCFWRSEDPCPKASPNTRHSWHRRCIAVWNFQPPEGSWDEASLQSPGWGWEAAGQIPQPKMEGASSSSPKSWRNFNWVGWETLIFHASRCWSKKRKAISRANQIETWIKYSNRLSYHHSLEVSLCSPPPHLSPKALPDVFLRPLSALLWCHLNGASFKWPNLEKQSVL